MVLYGTLIKKLSFLNTNVKLKINSYYLNNMNYLGVNNLYKLSITLS